MVVSKAIYALVQPLVRQTPPLPVTHPLKTPTHAVTHPLKRARQPVTHPLHPSTYPGDTLVTNVHQSSDTPVAHAVSHSLPPL